MTTEIRTDEALAVLLGTLGSNADEVADKLRAAGIKGKKAEPTCCPIANWLKRETGCQGVDAGLSSIYVGYGMEDPAVNTPYAVAEFIHRFDDGVYLDLVEQPGTTS